MPSTSVRKKMIINRVSSLFIMGAKVVIILGISIDNIQPKKQKPTLRLAFIYE
jgi:hypothetical protein